MPLIHPAKDDIPNLSSSQRCSTPSRASNHKGKQREQVEYGADRDGHLGLLVDEDATDRPRDPGSGEPVEELSNHDRDDSEEQTPTARQRPTMERTLRP